MFAGVGFQRDCSGLPLAIVLGGVVTGLLAGLFGVGGGAVIVPVLYEVFRILGVPEAVHMQLCVGTSLAIILPTTIRSYLTHRQKGLVVPRVIRLWALPAVIGVGCGAAIAAFAPPAVFKIAFVLIALLIAIKFLFAGDRWNLGTDLPGTVPMTFYGFGIGLAGSLMGISGGSLSNIVLTLYGKTIHQAVATSAGLGVPITIVGTIGYILAGLPRPRTSAAVVAWLRLTDRRCADGADVEPRSALRCTACPPALAAYARTRLQCFSFADFRALSGQHDLGIAAQQQAVATKLPSFAGG